MSERKPRKTEPYRGRELAPRKKRRRKPTPFAYVVILITVAACAVSLSAMIFFKVETIRITGKTRYSAQQILDAGGVGKGMNLFAIDKKKASGKICSALPYIRSVEIKLMPLSTVELAVEEDKPSSIVALTSGYAVLDQESKVLEIRPGIKNLNLPMVKGMKVSYAQPGSVLRVAEQSQIQILSRIRQSMTQAKLKKVSTIDITNDLEITASYDQRIKIEIGTASDLSQKMNLAAYVIANKISASEKGSLDVTEASKAYFDPS
ncbi:MAG TPA: FtsQ-type POTRA domain-containing protein [Clostridia bacterium]|nr:FtsQ-type POTRA domain-containing protein [Clostridia bacterium]